MRTEIPQLLRKVIINLVSEFFILPNVTIQKIDADYGKGKIPIPNLITIFPKKLSQDG